MLAIACAAVILVAGELYLENQSTHVPPVPAAKMAFAPLAEFALAGVVDATGPHPDAPTDKA
jgi:hypothetical protein